MDTYKEMEEMTRETQLNIMEDWFYKWPELLKWLESKGFYEYPAAKSHHGNIPNGLFRHSLQVTYELKKLTHNLGLKWQRDESPEIIGMLHDVCKLDDYSIGEGFAIDMNKERLFPGHGEKSLIMLMGHIDLTDEEIMCIRYHMGAFTDSKEWEYYSRAVQQYPNVLYTHTADMIASQIKGI